MNPPGAGGVKHRRKQPQQHTTKLGTVMPEWEDIATPAGSFIGWGTKVGQHVTGRVVDYSIDAGVDYNGNKCPQLAMELTEKAASFNKEGERNDYEPGDMIQLTCAQVKLKAGVRSADPKPGDLMKIELINVSKTANGNTLKEFGIKIARGAGGTPAVKNEEEMEDKPPF